MVNIEKRFILVLVEYKVKHGKRDAFVNIVSEKGILKDTRGESGNMMYEYFYPPGDENKILLVEMWADKYALREHLEKKHAKLLSEIKKDFIETTVFRTIKATEKLEKKEDGM